MRPDTLYTAQRAATAVVDSLRKVGMAARAILVDAGYAVALIDNRNRIVGYL